MDKEDMLNEADTGTDVVPAVEAKALAEVRSVVVV